MNQCAEVFRKNRKFFVASIGKTTAGVGISIPPFFSLDAAVKPEEIGGVLLKALAASRENLPHPDDWDHSTRPFLDHVGAKSYSEFARGAVSCFVERRQEKFCFEPSENKGASGGFVSRDGYAFSLSVDEPVAIGNATIQALDLSL